MLATTLKPRAALPVARQLTGLEGFANIVVRAATSARERSDVRRFLTQSYTVLATATTSVADLEHDLYPEDLSPGNHEFTSVAYEGDEIVGTASMHWVASDDDAIAPVDALSRFQHPDTWEGYFGCSPKLVGEMGRLAMCARLQRPECRSSEIAIYRELVQLLKEQAANVGLARLISIMPRSTRRLTYATGHAFWPIEECTLALEAPGNRELFAKYERYWLPKRPGLAPVLFEFETLADAKRNAQQAKLRRGFVPAQQSEPTAQRHATTAARIDGTALRVLGMGHALPKAVVGNDTFVASGKVDEQWIIERTGVRERHWAGHDEHASSLGARAAEQALRAAGLSASEVDVLICTTVTPDCPLPSTACLIQAKLGASRAAAFDVAAACSGFLYGSWLARQIISGDAAKVVLLVSVDVLSPFVQRSDVRTAVLFGDGAAAAVFAGRGAGMQLFDVTIGSDGSKGDLLSIPAGGSRLPASIATVEGGLHCVKMEGPALFKMAVEQMTLASKQLLADNGLCVEDVKLFVAHQANRRIIDAVAQRLQLDPARAFVNIDEVGNTAAASIPIALDQALRAGRAQPGDLILLTSFGGGVTWGCALLRVDDALPAMQRVPQEVAMPIEPYTTA